MTATLTARPARVLDADQLRSKAPSIFAAEPWHAMSGRYRMVPTIEVVGMLADRGFRPTMAGQARTRIEGKGDFTRHVIRFRHESYLAPGPADAEVPELVLANSHDGTSAYKFMSGIFRLVCENGMIVQSADFGSISVRHSGGKDFEERVIDATYEVMDDAPRTLEKIAGWKQLQLEPPQALVFASAVAEMRDNPIANGERLIATTRRPEDRASDLWTTANRVQENVIRGGIRGRNPRTGKRSTTRPVGSVSEDIRLNRAIWTLTEKMAELVAR